VKTTTRRSLPCWLTGWSCLAEEDPLSWLRRSPALQGQRGERGDGASGRGRARNSRSHGLGDREHERRSRSRTIVPPVDGFSGGTAVSVPSQRGLGTGLSRAVRARVPY